MDHNQIIRTIHSLNNKVNEIAAKVDLAPNTIGGGSAPPAPSVDVKRIEEIEKRLNKIGELERIVQSNFNTNNDKITAVNNTISQLNGKVDKLTADLNKLREDFNKLPKGGPPAAPAAQDGKQAEMEGKLASMSNDLNKLREDVDKLPKGGAPPAQDGKQDIEGKLTSITNDINGLKVTKTDNRVVEELKKSIEHLTRIKIDANALNPLKNDIEDAKKKIANIPAGNNANNAEVMKRLDTFAEKKAVEEINNSIKSNFEVTNKKFDEVHKGVVELSSNITKVNEIDERLKKIEAKA